MIRFEEAQLHHPGLIARNMRAADIDEVKAGWGDCPQAAIHEAVLKSYFARTVFWDLQPLAIFGLCPLSVLANTACVWVFGTAAIDQHRIAFAKASRVAVDLLFTHCTLMTNLIDANDSRALKWMHWLGGSVMLPPQVRGGRRFLQFIVDDRKRQCQRA